MFYFPSYELVLDDLRDYRFYETDLLHPNNQAIDYIWDKFSCITDKKIEVIDPIYNQKHLLNIWNFSVENKNISFATNFILNRFFKCVIL